MTWYAILVILAVLTRLGPHPANVAPIGGLALLVGATALNYQGRQRFLAFSLPLVALLISDAFIGFYDWPVMISVYLGFIVTIFIGLLVRRSYHWQTILVGSLAGSVIFFLLTNAAVWAFTPMYSKALDGLIESYTLALPFFRNSLIGDLLYTGVLFTAYESAIRPTIQVNKLKERPWLPQTLN